MYGFDPTYFESLELTPAQLAELKRMYDAAKRKFKRAVTQANAVYKTAAERAKAQQCTALATTNRALAEDLNAVVSAALGMGQSRVGS